MLSLIQILYKVIVAKFYEQNAGLFLFVFFLMFGIVESSQLVFYHLSLIAGIIESPVFLAIVSAVWLAYMIKCVQFAVSRFTAPENEFLFGIALLHRWNQSRVIFPALLIMDVPVLLYACPVVITSFYSHHPIVGGVILLFHLAVLILATLFVRRRINSTHVASFAIPLPVLRWPRPRPFPFFYLGQLSFSLKTVMGVTKIFSCLALLGFMQIPLDVYDIRIVLMGVLFGLAAHAVIVFEFRKFEDRYLDFTRSLPMSMLQRYWKLCAVYLMLLLPETAFLLVNSVPWTDTAGILLFGTGLLLTSHCSLYTRELNMDRHVQRTLWIFLGSFMAVLCRIWLVEMMLLWAVSFLLFDRRFYRYEGAQG